MSRASSEALDGLHAAVAEALKDAITNPEKLTPAMLSQAIKFLKDNGIDAPAASSRISELDAELARKLDSMDMDDFGQFASPN